MKKKSINIESYKGRVLQGIVSGCSMQKTIKVKVDTKHTHKLYKKIINTSTTHYAHDENQECAVGDLVQIKESRPISKNKSWVLLKIVEKAIVEKTS